MLASKSSKRFFTESITKDVIRKNVTLRDIEKLEVAQLSCKIGPCSKPSRVFERLEEKRKVRHEEVLNRLEQSLQEINEKVEKEIKICSVELKAHFKEFDEKLNNIIVEVDKPEVASYCPSVFLEFQSTANEIKRNEQELTEELYQNLNKFEDERAKENEKLLRRASAEMTKVGYLLPYEVQTFVEHEALKMNQLSLNNRRCYEDLKLTLTLLAEQSYKSFMDKIFCLKEKWVQYQLQSAYSDFQEKKEKSFESRYPRLYPRLELQGHELMIQMSPDNLYSTCKIEKWLKNIEEVLGIIEAHGKNLFDMYKKTMDAAYQGFDKKVQELKKELNTMEDLEFEERIIKPLKIENQQEQLKEVEYLEVFWQETLVDIREHLKDLTLFLLDTGKIWDRHLERLCESKKLIFKALEKADNNNELALQEMETKLNILLDSLRQEHNEAKLTKAYDAVVPILDAMKSKYESIYLQNVAIVEDYYKMMDLEADMLSAEIKEFLFEMHTPQQGRTITHFLSDRIRFIPEEKCLFKEIQVCALQIQSLKSWKLGAWTALEALSRTARETLKPRAESWVKTKIENLAEKMSMQLNIHDKRLNRIKCEIYEKRREEIKGHEESLENHKEKLKAQSEKIKEEYRYFLKKVSNKINEIEENLNEIESHLKEENRFEIIRGNQLMVMRKQKELNEELKLMFDRFRAVCESNESDLKHLNVNYMKSIKLFHENGNYSVEEGNAFVTALENIDKDISKEFENIVSDSSNEENEFARKLDLIFSPALTLFNELLEETSFYHDIRESTENLKKQIRTIAEIIKSNLDHLNSHNNCLVKFIHDSKEAVENINERHWDSLIRNLYLNVSNLFYPLSFPETPGSTVTEEEIGESSESETTPPCQSCCAGKFPVQISNSKLEGIRSKKESFTCTDCRSSFFNFDFPPENDGTLMSNITDLFWKEMGSLQKTACNFYKQVHGRKLLREDLIPVSYDAFTKDLITRFRSFYRQIQQFWLHTILEFLPVIQSVKLSANLFLLRKLDNYQNSALKALTNFEEKFKVYLKTQSNENSMELKTLDNKLLPMFGYPHNRHLLDALEEEVVRLTANQKLRREEIIKKFKNQLNCFRIQHVKNKTNIKTIESYYNKFKDILFINDLGNNIINIILEFCERGGYTSNTALNKENRGVSFENVAEEIPREYRLNLEDFTKEHFETVQHYLEKLRRIAEKERVFNVLLPECSPTIEQSVETIQSYLGEGDSVTKLNILLPILNLEQTVDETLGGLNEYILKVKDYADNQKDTQGKVLLEWLNCWKTNVQKILNLYKVKEDGKTASEKAF